MNAKQLSKKWENHVQATKTMALSNKNESPSEKNQRIEKAKKEYNFFCQYYFPHLTCNDDGKPIENAFFHKQAAAYIFKNRRTRAVFEWARGHAKSTHMTLLIPLWLKINKQFKTLLIIGKSQEFSIRMLKNIQEELSENDRYINDFGLQKKEGDWADSEFRTTDDCAFIPLGRGQSPRGIINKGHRPDYIVIDDIDDDEMCRNESRINDTMNWIQKALFNTMDAGNGRFIVVGNRIAKNSIVAQLAQQPNFYHTKINAINDKGTPSWAEKYKIEELDEVRKSIGESAWQQEFMNNPLTKGSVFKHIAHGDMLPLKQYKAIIGYTDPSFKNTDKSDYKATAVVGLTNKGHYHILRAFVRKASISEMIAWHYLVFEEMRKEAPIIFYMEANFIQDFLLKDFNEEGNKRGLHLPIKGDTRKKPDKFQRIESLEPLFSNEKIIINNKLKENEDMQTLLTQLTLFERGSRINDDAPDALEGAIFLLNQKNFRDQPNYMKPRNLLKNKNRF